MNNLESFIVVDAFEKALLFEETEIIIVEDRDEKIKNKVIVIDTDTDDDFANNYEDIIISDQELEEMKCEICFESRQNAKIMPCKHKFCYRCLSHQTITKCPACRFKIDDIILF